MGAIISCICGSGDSDEERQALLQNGDGRRDPDNTTGIDSEYGSADLLNSNPFGSITGIDDAKREKYLLKIVSTTDDNLIDIFTIEHAGIHSSMNQRPLKEFRKMFSGRAKRKNNTNEDEAGGEESEIDEDEAVVATTNTNTSASTGKELWPRNKAKNKSKGSIALSLASGNGGDSATEMALPVSSNKRGTTGRRDDNQDLNAPISGSVDSAGSAFLPKKQAGRNSTTNTVTDTSIPASKGKKGSKDLSLSTNGNKELTIFGDSWEIVSSPIPKNERKWILDHANSAFEAFKSERQIYGEGDLLLNFA